MVLGAGDTWWGLPALPQPVPTSTLFFLPPSIFPVFLFSLPSWNWPSEFCIGWAGPTWTARWIPAEVYFLLAPVTTCRAGPGPKLHIYYVVSIVYIYVCSDGKFSALEGMTRVYCHDYYYDSYYQQLPSTAWQALYMHLLSLVFQ